MKKIVWTLVAASTLLVSGCGWKTVYIDAASEDIVFMIDRKGILGRGSRVLRCQGPGACVEVHSP